MVMTRNEKRQAGVRRILLEIPSEEYDILIQKEPQRYPMVADTDETLKAIVLVLQDAVRNLLAHNERWQVLVEGVSSSKAFEDAVLALVPDAVLVSGDVDFDTDDDVMDDPDIDPKALLHEALEDMRAGRLHPIDDLWEALADDDTTAE